ncbi:DUF5074 domain-containing protein [Mucilaginibacter pocheonensis]|uniref:YVTN family beta-propeller protein n=1 Tax=Mucilaginibacter pocheonensis TaxID=398050 RepID=A0ABU1TDI9_9SPHI|nr:DUF5074 domain-containing protein [Mucilaginibacter pocheonensis]MDR6943427.1 YVTN family beta-propeller protein [Mucilaginibacter pocheonensis]
MKQLKLKSLFIGLTAVISFTSCHKDKKIEPDDTTNPPVNEVAGIYVLNQGKFNSNNSSLTYYDVTSKLLVADQYKAVNGSGIGDTGNDLKVYGSKMYIVVNVSSTVEVVNAKSAKLIKNVSFFNGAVARQPRSVAFYKNKAYITSYDNTVAVMDTATLEVSKYITVGRNPEQLVVSNGKLYVANSGGLDFGNPDKTVSVIDLATDAKIKDIPVGLNPITVAADSYGDVFVVGFGNFGDVPTLTIINSTTDQASAPAPFTAAFATPMAISGDFAYFITSDNKIQKYDVKAKTIVSGNFITDGTVITTPYGIKVNDLTGEVFVTDAKDYQSNGKLFAFDKSGKLEYSINTGISPGAVAFIYK